MGTEQPIRLMLADDHTAVRQGLRAALTDPHVAGPGREIAIIAEVGNGREAVKAADEKREALDVILMDINMPNLNGLEAARQIMKRSPMRIVILSGRSDEKYLRQAMEAGCVGYLTKHSSIHDIARGIRAVMNDQVAFSGHMAKILTDQYRDVLRNGFKRINGYAKLTDREREVLQLIAEGYTNKLMADHLCISIKTIEKHRQQVMNKLGIHHVAGLTAYAFRTGVISLEEKTG